MAARIQIRRDTAANWAANNPVLAIGEAGFVTDLNKIKLGDGTTSWNSLNYLEVTNADKLKTPRTITLGGDLTGSASFDGSENITITASVESQSSVNSLTGTANEIEVSASVGDVTLSLPSTINANTTGTAASLTNARTINLSGDVSGSVNFDGSASVDIVTTIQPDSVALGTDTTGNYVTQVTGSGDGISVTGSGESASVVVSNTGVTALVGTENEVEVSASTGSVTISLPNTINANTTGSAATLTNARTIALSGDVSGSVTFDGSASVDISTQIQPNSVALGTDTSGNYVTSVSASGDGISVTGTGEGAEVHVFNTGVTSLAGTENQLAVSASSGAVTLSLPAAVTFPGTVTLNADPGQALEAATKQYVDAVAEGLHVHASVFVATTASVDLESPSASVDGVALTNNMRVLVKDQVDQSENGIYVYNSASAILTRASDFDTVDEIQGGDFVFVTNGDTYTDTGWVQTNIVETLGTDPINWTQFSGAGIFTAGTGLFLDGTVFSNTGVLSIQGTGNEIDVSASTGAITLSLPETINAATTGNAATASALQNARTIALSGDISGSVSFDGSASVDISSTLANSGVSASTYGSATNVPVLTVDAKGRITSASVAAIVSLPSQSSQSGKFLTTDGTEASWSFVAASSLTGTLPISLGGTNSTASATAGGISYGTGTAYAFTAVGTTGQVLTSNGSSAPTWQDPTAAQNIDGGFPASVYGGITAIDGGVVT